MSIELKPCPHCGSEASFRIVSHQLLGGEHPLAGMEYIDCNDELCGASTIAMYSTGEDCKPLLAERWNRRFDAAIKAAQPQEFLQPTREEVEAEIVTDEEMRPQQEKLLRRMQEMREAESGKQPSAISDERIEEAVQRGMRLAWQLGQTYWQQADSESWKQNAMAKETIRKFNVLLDETIARATAQEGK